MRVPGIDRVNTRVICLGRKRKERCDVNLPSIKSVFPNAQWFEAIDVNNVDISDTRIVHPVAQIHIRDGTETDYDHVASKGAVGASLSHAALWKQCVDSGEPMVVVEDDMYFTKEIQKTLRTIYSNIPENTDFAALMYIPTNNIGWKKEMSSIAIGGEWTSGLAAFKHIILHQLRPRRSFKTRSR